MFRCFLFFGIATRWNRMDGDMCSFNSYVCFISPSWADTIRIISISITFMEWQTHLRSGQVVVQKF
jgi:hypothetical protein